MTTTTLATKFEVGKTYHSENGVKIYTVLRRTEKTVWMETEDNKTIQKRIKVTNFGNEKITDNFLETTSDCETLEPVMEPQGYLQIGGVRFYQFFQDMNVNVPTDWDILEDPIYYTTINGQVVLYNDITRELVTEPQDNQDELVKTYEVSTVEGLETDEPEYNVYIVTATNPSTAAGIIKARLMSQKTRFNILGVSEAPIVEDDDEWLEF